jgi:hypothetical protein
MATVARYVVEHWRGQMPLFWSFLVNGVGFYILLVSALLGFNAIINSSSTTNPVVFWTLVALFGCGMVWSFVGIARASWRALREPTVGIVKKGFAVIFMVGVALIVMVVVSDIARLA